MNNCSICYNPDIDKLIYESKYTLNRLSTDIVKSKLYGYACDKNAEYKVNVLNNFLSVLENESSNIALGGEGCLNSFKLQSLAEKVRKFTTSCNINNRSDLKIDESKEQEWIINNPYCVSRESWEKIAYAICSTFRLEVQRTKDICDTCDLRFDVLSEKEYCDLSFEITRNLIACDIILAIQVYKSMCDLNFKITRNEIECKLDFDILVNEHKCDLNFSVYKKLIDCNLSFDIIKTVYENGCTFEYTSGEVFIVSAMNKYPVNKLNFGGQINPMEIKKLKLNTSNSKYLKDPKAFIEKLKSDYGK